MADYIRRDIVLQIINTVHETGGFAGYADYCTLFDEIDTMPAADVQPVKRGRWTDNVYKYVKSLDAYFIQAKCSVCGRYSDRIDIYSRFMSNECCSRCGARMDGDTE